MAASSISLPWLRQVWDVQTRHFLIAMPYVVEKKKKKKNKIHSRRKRLITKSGLWECCVTIRIITCMSIRFQLNFNSWVQHVARDLKIQILPPHRGRFDFNDYVSSFLLAFKRDARVADHPLCFSGWSLLCMDDFCCSSFWGWITATILEYVQLHLG